MKARRGRREGGRRPGRRGRAGRRRRSCTPATRRTSRLWQMFMPLVPGGDRAHLRRLDVALRPHARRELLQPDAGRRGRATCSTKGIAEREPGGGRHLLRRERAAGADRRSATGRSPTRRPTWRRSATASRQWKPDAILYVVDFRQALHFKNLFAAARRWGYDQVELEHVSFGSVLGEDGKPLKTREGGGRRAGDLLDEAVQRAGKVYEQIAQEPSNAARRCRT